MRERERPLSTDRLAGESDGERRSGHGDRGAGAIESGVELFAEGAGAGGSTEAKARVFQDRDGFGATVGANRDGELDDRAVDALDVGFGWEFAIIPAAGEGGRGTREIGTGRGLWRDWAGRRRLTDAVRCGACIVHGVFGFAVVGADAAAILAIARDDGVREIDGFVRIVFCRERWAH